MERPVIGCILLNIGEAGHVVTVVARDSDLDPFLTNAACGTWLYFVLVPLGWIFL